MRLRFFRVSNLEVYYFGMFLLCESIGVLLFLLVGCGFFIIELGRILMKLFLEIFVICMYFLF